jgi:acetyl esterase/lipase
VSPVSDLTLRSSETFRGIDAVVRRTWLRSGVESFVGAAEAAELSPLTAELAGLPPVLLQVAGRERLRAEGEQLAARLSTAGAKVELEVLPRLWHDTHMVAHLVPEGADAVRRIGHWLADRLAARPDLRGDVSAEVDGGRTDT